MAQRESSNLVSIDISDEKVSSVLESLKAQVDGIVYSKSALAQENGEEHVVTAKLNGLPAPAVIRMLAEAIGCHADIFEDGAVLVRPDIPPDISAMMPESMEGEEDDDDDLPF